MPSLVLLRTPIQPPPIAEVELFGDPRVIGRDARNAQIVIPHESVSRTHARINARDGAFFVEDLGSRNGTFVNHTELTPHEPVELKPDDRIRICDFVFQFRHEDDVPLVVEATHDFLVAPGDRLRVFMAISAAPPGSPDLGPLLNQVADTLFSTNLSRTFELDALLQQIVDTLLGVFKHADRCFVLLLEESGRPVPGVVRGRGIGLGEEKFNRNIVRKTLDSVQSHLATETADSASPRSLMCAPLATSEGRSFGAILLETHDPAKKFGTDDLHLFTILANLASVAIERAQMHEKARGQAVVQNQIDLARRVLLGFLPQSHPEVPGYEFYSHYSPAQTVGGDYYDFVPLPGGRVAVVLGDVAGKGVPAALLVAKLSSEVRYSLLSQTDPAKAVALLNDQMIRGGLADKFVTLALMVLDPAWHRLTVVNAGHNSPRLFSAAKQTLEPTISIEATGLPIGVTPGYQYRSVTLNLAPGDTIAAYTDGVTDAMNPAGRAFGTESADRHLTPGEMAGPDAARPKRMGEFLVNAVRRHAEGRSQYDDIAIVCFGRWDPESDPGTTLTGNGYVPGRPM